MASKFQTVTSCDNATQATRNELTDLPGLLLNAPRVSANRRL